MLYIGQDITKVNFWCSRVQISNFMMWKYQIMIVNLIFYVIEGGSLLDLQGQAEDVHFCVCYCASEYN